MCHAARYLYLALLDGIWWPIIPLFFRDETTTNNIIAFIKDSRLTWSNSHYR